MIQTTTLATVIAVLESAYPPGLAESWDSVGLVCGDPADPVRRVLVCVDVTADVVDAALDDGVDLIVAHHPLLLRGVDTVAASTPKGSLIHRLIRGGCALYTAHTNADRAAPGVSDALAQRLGLVDCRPLQPGDAPSLDKWTVMVPDADATAVTEAMFAAGAGAVGDYRACSWTVSGTGQFEPQAGARPHIGAVGSREQVAEQRVEMVAERRLRSDIAAAVRSAHPYEEPAFDVIRLAALPAPIGLGRVGRLPHSMSFGDFVAHAREVLPTGGAGIRGAGAPGTMVETVAVCGGAGDSLLDTARSAGADVYLTGDLRHHVVDEHLRAGGPLLVDAGHWATEFPWCGQVTQLLTDALALPTAVFDRPTDPFSVLACER